MTIQIIIYNKKNKVVAHRTAPGDKWAKLYGKLASAVGYKWSIKAVYGFGKNFYGERVLFKNEGTYHKLSDAKHALSAFIEK